MSNRAYLDYAATAPLCHEAAEALAPYISAGLDNMPAGANANSLYSEGRSAFAALEQARRDITAAIGARRSDEVIITGGATEADNAAVEGITAACRAAEAQQGHADFVPHLVTSVIEHDAVLAPMRALEAAGCKVAYIDVDKNGFLKTDDFRAALDTKTVLCSIMLANNEIGSIQPIKQLAADAHAVGSLFHTDAVQAFGKIPFSVVDLDVDAASFSGHKIGAVKGVGALYLRNRTPFSPIALGGGQENGLRSGTQNVMAAASFAAAAKAVTEHGYAAREHQRLMDIRDSLYARLTADPRIHATVDCTAGNTDYLPNIVNVHVDGLESETMILRFDMKGVALSGGSACSSHSLEPSRILNALGLPRDKALGSLRISTGRFTTQQDIDRLFTALDAVLDWN